MELHSTHFRQVMLSCVLAFGSTSSLRAQNVDQHPGYSPGQGALRPSAHVAFVYPNTTDWFAYTPDGSAAAITSTNPLAGSGSLELTKSFGSGSAFINESRTFGTVGALAKFSLHWFIDPASSSSLPPDIALRVYPFGDPRSFFLVWNGCSPTSCGVYPTGSWQRSDILQSLSIQQAEGNKPPASFADIPSDAPIIGIHLRASYSFGSPWHGFVDLVTLGFEGLPRTTYNFEVLPCVVDGEGDRPEEVNDGRP